MGGDFIESQGRAFLAHRLRRSSELIVEQLGAELGRMALAVPPRSASMLLLVDEEGPIGVVDIARRLRLSHPLIVRMAQQLEALGLVAVERNPRDARRKQLVPTDRGRREAAALRRLNLRLAAAFAALFEEIGCDLVAILDRADAALAARPMHERLSTARPEDPDET